MKFPLPPLLNILYLFQNDKDEHACNKLRDLIRESSADQKLFGYLWAAAWKKLRGEIPLKNKADFIELLVFTWLAQSYGTILTVPNDFAYLSDHFTTYVGTAYHQLAKATFYHRLPCEFPDLRLILRASCSP